MRAGFDYIVYARRNTPKIAQTATKQMGYLIPITFYFDEDSEGATLLTSVVKELVACWGDTGCINEEAKEQANHGDESEGGCRSVRKSNLNFYFPL